MAHAKPRRSSVARVTPMNADGAIDVEGGRALLSWHAEEGAEAVVYMGSTDAVAMLSPDEGREINSEIANMNSEKMLYSGDGFGNDSDWVTIASPANIRANACANTTAISGYVLENCGPIDYALGVYINFPRVSTDLHRENIPGIARRPNVALLKAVSIRVGQVAQRCAAKARLGDHLLPVARPWSGRSDHGAWPAQRHHPAALAAA